MANNFKRSVEAVNIEANQVCALLNNGYLRMYSATQPATADASEGTCTLLAELRWAATAFGSSTDGTAVAAAITKDSSANATGTAVWFRALKSDGSSKVFDGSVGTSGCDINMPTNVIQQNAEVTVDSFTYTANKG
jgi:hypothetical protein